jgi:hypothetical protein
MDLPPNEKQPLGHWFALLTIVAVIGLCVWAVTSGPDEELAIPETLPANHGSN